jgi:charged multivesicular body protein 7
LAPITTSDTAIAHLKTVQTSLDEQISLLTSQIATFTQKARDATSKQNRIIALSALKSRKLSESALRKRSDALARIEEVLNGVAQAASDAEVIRSLEGGASALERLNKDIGGIERVEKVMDRVREGIEESEDVGRVIAEMGSARVDEDEVQEEFDAMLKAEAEKKRKLQEEIQRRKLELERQERARKEAEEQVRKEQETKVTDDPAKQDGLVEELKSVSLNASPDETESRLLEEPIPS